MRRRTSAQIKACDHIKPLVEVTRLPEYGFRGDFVWRVMGCTRCGGIQRETAMHISYSGRSKRTAKELNEWNERAHAEYRTAVKAWIAALPEPEEADAQ